MEIFDFTVNALKELETELDRLSNNLADVTEGQQATIKALNERLSKIEEKAASLEEAIQHLKRLLLSPSNPKTVQQERNNPRVPELAFVFPLRMNCGQWEDFCNLAKEAQLLTFDYREAEKKFGVTAVKNGQTISYEGELPEPNLLLKHWLANQLQIANIQNIVQGAALILQQRKPLPPSPVKTSSVVADKTVAAHRLEQGKTGANP